MNIFPTATIAGKSLPQIHSAEVSQQLFQPCVIRIEQRFAQEDAQREFDKAVSSWLGEKLVLTIAEQFDSSRKKTYEGRVTDVSFTINSMFVTAHSDDYALTLARRYRSFVEKPVHDIVNLIVKDQLAQHEVKNPAKTLKFRFMQQYDETDSDFLKRLARYDGCVFYHDGEKFHYAPKLGGNATVELNLDDIRPNEIAQHCSLGVTKWRGSPYDFVKHNEPSDCRKESGAYTPPLHPHATKLHDISKRVFANAVDEMFDEAITDKTEFEQFLKHQQALNEGPMLRVRGVTHHPGVAIGRTIKCPAHDILKHPVVVTGMNAQYRDNQYTCSFDAVPEGATVLPPTSHRNDNGTLQPAIVTSNKDSAKLGRVQIKYIWDADGKALAWGRLVHAGAGKTNGGKSYGTHYTPRIGDQVLVGCEHGDPSLPVILGALYHSERAPDFLTENGTEEVLVIRTPRESTIRVLDKEGAEEIVVSMKDNKNIIRLELKQPKITIESLNGTVLVHSKTIQFEADEKIQMKAKDIEINASSSLKIGSAKIESSASAENVIKGGMVKIN